MFQKIKNVHIEVETNNVGIDGINYLANSISHCHTCG